SELCAGLNRDSPFASLSVSWRYEQRVVSAHSAPSADGLNLDWTYIKNLVDLAVGGATRFAGYVDAVVAGQSSRAALDSFPGERWPEPTATDEWHLEMFL